MPWSLKLLYGLISDNLPLFGSKRKSYVILMGFIQFSSLFSVYFFNVENEWQLASLLFLSSLSGAYLDVLVDALMVVESRGDEEEGSEHLQSLSWGALGAGGVVGSLIGAFITEYSNPMNSFLIYSIFGLIVMILGMRL
jgi:MFS family permease